MSFALSEPPDSGVNASANAAGAAIRIAITAAVKAASSRRLGMPVGKAAGSYLRSRQALYFVPVAPSGVNPAGRAGPRRLELGATPARARAPAGGPRRAPRFGAA